MGKIRGFRLGHRFVKIFKRVIHKKSDSKSYRRLNPPCRTTESAMSKLCSWINYLKRGAKGLCFSKYSSGYIRAGQYPMENEKVSVPKGHLAVYVGEKEDYAYRVLVPVIYFNHPLFVGLLREAEKIYGFDHPGGIQIPCQISEFENVKTKIAGTSGGTNWHVRWRRRRQCL